MKGAIPHGTFLLVIVLIWLHYAPMSDGIKIVSEWDCYASLYKVGETNAEEVRYLRANFRDEFEARVLEILPGKTVTIEYDNETVHLGPPPPL